MEEALIVLVEVSKEPYATDHKLAASREWWEICETKMGKMTSKSIEANFTVNFTSPAPENCMVSRQSRPNSLSKSIQHT